MGRYRIISLLLVALGMCRAAAAFSVEPTPTTEPVRSFSDAQLLKAYQFVALAAGGSDTQSDFGDPTDHDYDTIVVKEEMLRRGSVLVPGLIDMLRTEAISKRPGASLIGDEIKLLVMLGDPRAVGPLLDIAETKSKARIDQGYRYYEDPRGLAIEAVKKLTFESFIQRDFGAGACVPNANAVHNDDSGYTNEGFRKHVQLYRDWLANEGKDPSQWLPLAQKRARALLEGDDLVAAEYAVLFFDRYSQRASQYIWHDDAPDRSVHRLGEIVAGATRIPGGGINDYQYHGKRLPGGMAAWIDSLTRYGPRARPWAGTIIRLEKELDRDNSGPYFFMSSVGGAEFMAFCFDNLPALIKHVADAPIDPEVRQTLNSRDPRLRYEYALGTCEGAIDRWAGRHFDNDQQRLDWWKANRGKSPEQWLADSLPIAAQRADDHEDESGSLGDSDRYFFHELIPDAPYGADEYPIDKPVLIARLGNMPEPFRAKWLDQHRAELRYDPNTGTFGLSKSAP